MTKPGDSPATKKTIGELVKEFPDKKEYEETKEKVQDI